MSKVNWDEHRKAFIEQKADSGITVKEYCEFYGLPFNTARRELNQKALAAMCDHAGDHKDDHRNDHAGDHAKKDDTVIRRNGRKLRHSAALEGVLEPRDDAAAQPGANKKGKAAHAKKINSAGERPAHTAKPRGEGKPFEDGHETKLVANRRGYPRPQDYEAAMEVLGEGVDASAATALYDSLAHMQLLKRTTARALALFEEEAENFGKEKKDDDSAGGPHPVLKMTKLMIEVGYLVNDHATRVAAIATGTDKNRRENEKHGRTHNAADVIAKAYQLRDEKSWDLVETAEYIERHGIKLPESLAKRLENEMKNAEPPVDESTQVDEEELDKAARQYRAAKASNEAVLAERRAAVAQLVDNGNYGDYTSTGERRDGEFVADNSHADIDFEATSDLYDEEIPPEIEEADEDDD